MTASKRLPFHTGVNEGAGHMDGGGGGAGWRGRRLNAEGRGGGGMERDEERAERASDVISRFNSFTTAAEEKPLGSSISVSRGGVSIKVWMTRRLN